MKWLTSSYNIWTVTQKSPGKLFEYPALRFAQYLCEDGEQAVLYVHTKGAAKNNGIQKRIRYMWKNQFTGRHARDYFTALEEYDVVCPLCGSRRETWFNGMLLSSRALKAIPTI